MGTQELAGRVRTSLLQAGAPRSRLFAALAFPTVSILCAETLLFLGYVKASLLIHLVTFVGCSLAPLVTRQESVLFRVFLLLPLFRLLNLGMPVFFISTLAWLPVIYGSTMVATYVTAESVPAVRLPEVGDLIETVVYAPLALVAALLLASVEYAILQPESLVEAWGGPGLLTFVLVMVVFVGFGEEFLFRGVLQSTIDDRAGPVPAVAISGFLFGVMHSTSGLPGEVAFGVAAGLLLGVVYHRTSNLLLVALVHGTLNVFLYGLFPLVAPVIGFGGS